MNIRDHLQQAAVIEGLSAVHAVHDLEDALNLDISFAMLAYH